MSDNAAVAVADAVAEVLSDQAKSPDEEKKLNEEPSRRNLNSNKNANRNDNHIHHRYDKFVLIPRQRHSRFNYTFYNTRKK